MSDRIREDEAMSELLGASIESCQMFRALLVLGGALDLRGRLREDVIRTWRRLHRALLRSGVGHDDRPPVADG